MSGIIGTAGSKSGVIGVVQGVTDGSSAGAGYIGEVLEETFSTACSTTAANMDSITLTAGDWDVTAGMAFNGSAGTYITCSLNTTSATHASAGGQFGWYTQSTNGVNGGTIVPKRYTVSASTTVYFVANVGSSSGTLYGFLHARRCR